MGPVCQLVKGEGGLNPITQVYASHWIKSSFKHGKYFYHEQWLQRQSLDLIGILTG